MANKSNTNNYTETIVDKSTGLEKINLMIVSDRQDAVTFSLLMKEAETNKLLFTVDSWCIIDVHNENGKDKDYTVLVILDETGVKYCTSSHSFITRFQYIIYKLREFEESDSHFSLACITKPSKNYETGFLTCSLVQ